MAGAKAPPKTQSTLMLGAAGALLLRWRCPLCNLEHPLGVCTKFLAMSFKGRDEFCRQKKLCYRCLVPNHYASECWSQRNCGVCGGYHHDLLHCNRPSLKTLNSRVADSHGSQLKNLNSCQAESRDNQSNTLNSRQAESRDHQVKGVNSRAAESHDNQGGTA